MDRPTELNSRGLEALAVAVRYKLNADKAFEELDNEELLKKYYFNGPVLRTFICKNCGRVVEVRRKTDKRKTFCCERCEKKYWKDKYLRDEKDSQNSKNKRKRRTKHEQGK